MSECQYKYTCLVNILWIHANLPDILKFFSHIVYLAETTKVEELKITTVFNSRTMY